MPDADSADQEPILIPEPSEPSEYESLIDQARARLAELSFREFVKQAWPWVEPARPFIQNWCTDAICDHLESVTRGQIKKLIINIPPGFGKSTFVSVLWPCWEWLQHPSLRWIFATHKEALTLRDSVRRRDVVIGNDWYQRYWGDRFRLIKDNERFFGNDKQGSMLSTSTGGGVTGFRGERLVLDDPHDPDGAISEVQRESTTEWLNLTWPTRLNETPLSAEVLVMQRLHEADATGIYLKQGGWTHLKIPLEHKGKRFCIADKREIEGTLIDERVYSRSYVEDKKKRLGAWGEAAQYDQEPMPLGGGLFRASWFESRWSKSDKQPGYLSIKGYEFDPSKTFRFCTVDLAMTEKTIGAKKLNDPDWTVMAAWCAFGTPKGPELMLLDMIRVRMEGPDTLTKLQAFHKHWKFAAIGVEDIAEKMWYQQAKRMNLPVREVSTRRGDDVIYTIDRDKVSRAVVASALLADGRFHIPDYAPWVSEYLDEMFKFPNASHDDVVDVTSMACAIASKYSGALHTANGEEKEFSRVPQSDRHDVDKPVDPTAGYFCNSPY